MTSRVSAPRVVNIADLRRLARAPAAARRLRLHRRRRRARDHAARELPRVRDGPIPPALRRRDAARATCAPRCSAPRSSCRSCSRRSAAAGCSIRAAKRWPRARRARRHRLHPLDALRLPAGRSEGGDERPVLVPALSRRRPRRRAGRHRARAQPPASRALVVTIDTPVAGMRERDVRNGTKELLTRKPLTMLPLRLAVPRAAALARRLPRATAA